MNPIVHSLFLVIALSAGASPTAVAEPVDARAVADRWLDLAASDREGELESALQHALTRDDWTDGQREAALYRFAVGARRLAVEQVPMAQLERLAGYEARVMVAHPESRGALMLPRFDVAGAASGTIEHARFRRSVNDAQLRMAEDPAGFWREPMIPEGAVLAEVVALADPAVLRAGRDAALQIWGREPAVVEALVTMALRLRDLRLAEALIREGDARHVLGLVSELDSVFPPRSVLDLLTLAAGRKALASEAVMAAGRLARHSATARQWLLARLADDGLGASAAAALARLQEPVVVAKAIEGLKPGKSEVELRNRLLMLHLSGTPEAERALRAFADDPEAPPSLREEVRRWQ